MATSHPMQQYIQKLKAQYDALRMGKDSLLRMIDEAEISESVYNSNAIENSTLTLRETEKILLEMEVSRNVNIREIYEAKNLAQVIEYVRIQSQVDELTKEKILLLHKMLIGTIDDSIAGRFRTKYEYVRVGTHVAPAPEHLERLIESILIEYSSNHQDYFLDTIVKFHLDFETIHPFNDGNGRIGRVIVNYQLQKLGYPQIIIRDKSKHVYYQGFITYRENKNTKLMERVFSRALTESLHKRITYLKGMEIIPLTEYAIKQNKPAPIVLNAALRQTIPAFRERGVWKIGV